MRLERSATMLSITNDLSPVVLIWRFWDSQRSFGSSPWSRLDDHQNAPDWERTFPKISGVFQRDIRCRKSSGAKNGDHVLFMGTFTKGESASGQLWVNIFVDLRRRWSPLRFLQNRNNCYDLCCMPTPTDHIVVLLLAERDRLNRAIEAIQGPVKRRGRPPGTAVEGLSVVIPKKRHVSAASRRRMALAQKRRWAARRAARS
jgi:hypothetical protein